MVSYLLKMNNKITIIEGPTPIFEPIRENSINTGSHAWAAGILEGPFLYDMAFTTLRTFNSQLLMDRCENTWDEKKTMFLEYRDRIGLTQQTPILAARAMEVEEGEMLMLWVRRELNSDTDVHEPDDLEQ